MIELLNKFVNKGQTTTTVKDLQSRLLHTFPLTVVNDYFPFTRENSLVRNYKNNKMSFQVILCTRLAL